MNSFEGIKDSIDLNELRHLFLNNPIITNKKNKSKVYSLLYDLGNIQFKKYNPCKIKNETCFWHSLNNDKSKTCCSGCKYLSKKGCTVKNLTCKLYFSCFNDEYKELVTYLNYLKLIVCLYNIEDGCFKSKKEILK